MGDIHVVCDSNDIEDWYRIKGDRTIIKFSSRKKSSEFLNKKKKLKNLNIGLWRKCYGLWPDKIIVSFYTINGISRVIVSFYTINGIWRVKKSEHDKPFMITHDEDL